MGLGYVEVIMEVEDAFDIEIPDAQASELETPGQLSDYVADRLADLGRLADPSPRCETAMTFYELRRLSAAMLGVSCRSIRPGSPLNHLLRGPGRAAIWNRLAHATGLRALSHRPYLSTLETCLLIASPLAGAVPLIYAKELGPALSTLLLVQVPITMGAVIFRHLRHPPPIPAPRNCQTFGDLVRHVIARPIPSQSAHKPSTWTRARVWNTIVEIVSEHAAISRGHVTRNAHFGRDLEI